MPDRVEAVDVTEVSPLAAHDPIATLAATSGPAEPSTVPRAPASSRSVRWRFLGVIRNHKMATVAAAVIVALLAMCFIGPLLYHSDQVHANLVDSRLAPGSPRHPLGTDDEGFDELGRLMVGGRLSLEVGFTAAIFATLFGALVGAVAGYFGGIIDALLMRVVDALSSMPALFVLIFISHILTLNLPVLMLLIAYVAWLTPARLVRGEVITLKVREFVQAGHTMGGGARHAIVGHLLPNAAATMMVNATFQVADAILYVAALGYLGIVLPPPAADWGTMLSNGTEFTQAGYWWMVVFPGVAIVLVVLAFNILGDALNDAFTTRTLGRHV